MGTFLWILYLILFLYQLLLIGRLVLEMVASFARNWRPRGWVVVLVESIFTVTDPPVKAIRRVLKPVDLGSVRLDLSLFLVLIVVSIASVVTRMGAQSAMPLTLGIG